MLKELILNTLVQWLLFLFLPTLVYLVVFRKRFSFLDYLGLKRPERVERSLVIITTVIVFIYSVTGIYWLLHYDLESSGIYMEVKDHYGLGLGFIAYLIIQGGLRTGLLEEIVFRGFFINTFERKFGFRLANHGQALIFTAIHVLAMMSFPPLHMLLGIVFIYLLSLAFGRLFKDSGGSVVYPALFHAGLNMLVAPLITMLFS